MFLLYLFFLERFFSVLGFFGWVVGLVMEDHCFFAAASQGSTVDLQRLSFVGSLHRQNIGIPWPPFSGVNSTDERYRYELGSVKIHLYLAWFYYSLFFPVAYLFSKYIIPLSFYVVPWCSSLSILLSSKTVCLLPMIFCKSGLRMLLIPLSLSLYSSVVQAGVNYIWCERFHCFNQKTVRF